MLLAAVIVQLFLRVRRSRKDALALEEANHRHKVANDELFFDFGGTPAGANVKIHDIIFEEAE